ncbi:conserved hypothetical protein [Sphingomonas sp. EC-HK361]|nr:conserved hypothetical protein [Sphingomonas sp. EC-HK361]
MSAPIANGCGAGRRTRLSRHATTRVRQRSIPASVVDALLDFGERARSGPGAETCYFTKRAWKRFAAYLGQEARHFERYRACYAVIADNGQVVTACWRR